MTMTEGSGDDDVFDGVFDREAPQETVVETEKSETPSGQPRDDRGRFASQTPPQQEAQAEVQPQADAPPPSSTEDPRSGHMVPVSELTGTRTKLQGRIAELERLHLEAEARAKALEQVAMQSRHQPQPQVQQEVEEPDPYTDPQGWAQHQRNQVQEMIRQNRAAMSRRFAVAQYGAEAVQAALASVPNHVANGFYANSADPFGDLMEWHKEQQVRKEVGTDLDGFKKRIEDEVRQKVLAELKAGGANGQPQPRFPGSLANATATGAQGAVLTDEAMMGDVFSSSRDRRK